MGDNPIPMDVARRRREEAGGDIGGLVDQALDYIGRPGDLDIEMQRRVAPRELHDQRRQEGEPDALTVFKPLKMSSSDTAASRGDAARRTAGEGFRRRPSV
ncbi:hypothetical protein ABIE33_006601 [Ensifer sp. 4252]